MNATETTSDEFRKGIRKISSHSWIQFGVALAVAAATLAFASWWHRQTTSQLETVTANQAKIKLNQQSIDRSQQSIKDDQASIERSQESIQASQKLLNTGQSRIQQEQAAISNSIDELDSALGRLSSDIDQLGRVAAGIAGKTDDIHVTLTGSGAPIEPRLPPVRSLAGVSRFGRSEGAR